MTTNKGNTADDLWPNEEAGWVLPEESKKRHPSRPDPLSNPAEVKAYDDAFFGLDKGGSVWDVTSTGNEIRQQVMHTADEAAHEERTPNTAPESSSEIKEENGNTTIKPQTEIDEGGHVAHYEIGEAPLSLGVLSNQTFKNINSGEAAHVALSEAVFNENRLNIVLNEYNLGTNHDSIALDELNPSTPDSSCATSDIIIDLEKGKITCESVGEGPRSFLISRNGKKVSDVTNIGEFPDAVESGDVLVVLSSGIFESLVGRTKPKAYEAVKSTASGEINLNQEFVREDEGAESLSNDAFRASSAQQLSHEPIITDLPDEFLQVEAASKLKHLVTDSFNATNTPDTPKYLDTPIKRLFQKIADLHNTSRASSEDKWENINTESFIVYQIP